METTRIQVVLRKMGQCLAPLMFLAVAGAGFAQQGRDVPKTLQGSWVLESIYKTPNITGIDYKQEIALLKSRIVYSQNTVRSCGQSVPVTGSVIQQVSRKEFFESRYVNLEDLFVKDPAVTEIVLNGDGAGNCYGTYTTPGQDVYVLKNGDLIVDFEGVYYRAKREK